MGSLMRSKAISGDGAAGDVVSAAAETLGPESLGGLGAAGAVDAVVLAGFSKKIPGWEVGVDVVPVACGAYDLLVQVVGQVDECGGVGNLAHSEVIAALLADACGGARLTNFRNVPSSGQGGG